MGDANTEEEWKRRVSQDDASARLCKEIEARRCSRHLALGPSRPTREIDIGLPRAMLRKLTPNQQRQRDPVDAVGRLSALAKETLRLLYSMAADDCSCFGLSERVSELDIQ